MPETAEPLRVVFFGPPASGKTRLLRAVAAVLGKDAEDEPVDLIPVDHSPQKAVFPLQVLVDLPGPREETGAVQLIDCESRAANELLEHPDELRRESAKNELRDTIRRADAVVLTVDAGWAVPELRDNLKQFRTFLETLEEGRTFDRESGGLPVFVAITKCDSLLRPEDSRTQWLSRLTQRQNEILDQFHDLFDDGEAAFGSLDVAVVPTAVQMPDGNTFGIDGLSTDLLASARDHAERVIHTQRRLTATVGGLLTLFAIMVGVLGLLNVLGPPGPLEQLELNIRDYRDHAAPAEVRFSDANFAANRRKVQALLDSPEFPKLRPESQDIVRAWNAEFERYGEYRSKFDPPQFSPAEVRTAGEFQHLQQELATTLATPPEYRDAWRRTPAVQLFDKWTKDLELLGTTEDQLHGWYRELIRRATKLMLVESPNASWRDETETLFREAGRPPFPAEETIPGSPRIAVRRGESLTYEAAYRFERTESAQRDWAFASRKIHGLVEMCEALGMIPPAEGRPAGVLEIPDGNVPRSLALERLESLRKYYAGAMDGTMHWHVSQFPDPLRKELTRRLRDDSARGVRLLRGWIVSELGDTESIAAWKRVSEGFLVRPEIRAWGVLLQKYVQWSDQPAIDPVEDLANFLKREQFEWQVRTIELYLPDALRVEKLVPDGSFTMTVTPRGGEPRVTLFRNPKATTRDSHGAVWQFSVDTGTPAIRFAPGEMFNAEVILRNAETQWLLYWGDGRTKTYSFDRVAGEPFLMPKERPLLVPLRATGVKLTMLPESAAIRVPALLPALPGVK